MSVDADATGDELQELQNHVEATSPLVDMITNEVPLETRLIAK